MDNNEEIRKIGRKLVLLHDALIKIINATNWSPVEQVDMIVEQCNNHIVKLKKIDPELFGDMPKIIDLKDDKRGNYTFHRLHPLLEVYGYAIQLIAIELGGYDEEDDV